MEPQGAFRGTAAAVAAPHTDVVLHSLPLAVPAAQWLISLACVVAWEERPGASKNLQNAVTSHSSSRPVSVPPADLQLREPQSTGMGIMKCL